MPRPDLLLHPVRLRIVQALLGDRRMTTAQLCAELDDVSSATVYRHVGTLAEAGVLAVVEEKRARGAVERTYSLNLPALALAPSEVAALTPEQHRTGFRAFVAGLLAAWDRYTEDPELDVIADMAGYRHVALWLTDSELVELVTAMNAPMAEALVRGPGPGRRRRTFSSVLIPDPRT